MKIISLLFLTFFLAKDCHGQVDTDRGTAKIEYTANSRGLYKNISIENKTALVTNRRDEKPVEIKITEKQWGILVAELEKVNLEAIPNLKAPTQKRFHDGAAIANLKIIYKGKTYESQTFDNGFPPEKIKKLVETVLSFTPKE